MVFHFVCVYFTAAAAPAVIGQETAAAIAPRRRPSAASLMHMAQE